MTSRLFMVLCGLLATAISAGPARTQQPVNQVALLIANAIYPDAGGPLATTIKDARLLADELRTDKFDVDVKENAGKADMQRAIDAFTGKIKNGAVAVFYFSGFGIQVARANYLLPVDAQVWSEDDTKRDGISLDAVLSQMRQKGARVKIIMIDASRRNPYERRFRAVAAGLAALNAPPDTLAMFSAAPGTLVNDRAGDDSLFMSELIKEMRAPNSTAEEVFNRARIGVSRASNNEQVPWVSSTLIEGFSFGGAGKAIVASPPTPPTPVTPALKPKDSFRECEKCPDMVAVPTGSFMMGSTENERSTVAEAYAQNGIVPGTGTTGPLLTSEAPQHTVTIARPFAVSRFAVTFEQWDACVNDGGCNGYRPSDQGWGRGLWPVINVNWDDTQAYVAWLSGKTGKAYRLLSEAEWEYMARAGTATPFWWGSSISTSQANYNGTRSYGGQPAGENRQKTLPVNSFSPNPWGFYQVAGNSYDWVEDCFHDDYGGAPADGSAWVTGNCKGHVVRGGAWSSFASNLRTAYRGWFASNFRSSNHGFRVARTLTP
jgi:formylglycine-generating enzyme required for sulfatase activity